MSKLTFPIKNDSAYVRRDGAVVNTGYKKSAINETIIVNSPFGMYWVLRHTGRAEHALECPSDLIADYIEAPKTKGHIHASSMLFYAQDATETDKPWKRWEWKHLASNTYVPEWEPILSQPMWSTKCKYRRKPASPVFVTINGIDVPQPMQIAPERGACYYWTHLGHCSDVVSRSIWEGDRFDLARFKNGICHLTEKAAKLHANALISFTIVK